MSDGSHNGANMEAKMYLNLARQTGSNVDPCHSTSDMVGTPLVLRAKVRHFRGTYCPWRPRRPTLPCSPFSPFASFEREGHHVHDFTMSNTV